MCLELRSCKNLAKSLAAKKRTRFIFVKDKRRVYAHREPGPFSAKTNRSHTLFDEVWTQGKTYQNIRTLDEGLYSFPQVPGRFVVYPYHPLI
jgi:hypothetical protein